MIRDMSFRDWQRFWRQALAFAVTRTPMGTFGDLVLRSATVAERAASRTLDQGRLPG